MKNNFTMPFTESNITLHFTDNNYFCFENCAAYQQISAFGIKEMDAGWFDVQNKILYLIELKDFSIAQETETTLSDRAKNLVKKAADSLAMIESILLHTKWGQLLQNNLPCAFDNSYQIYLIPIIHTAVTQSQITNTGLLNTEFNRFFSGYRSIFDIRYAAVLSHDKAKNQFPLFVK